MYTYTSFMAYHPFQCSDTISWNRLMCTCMYVAVSCLCCTLCSNCILFLCVPSVVLIVYPLYVCPLVVLIVYPLLTALWCVLRLLLLDYLWYRGHTCSNTLFPCLTITPPHPSLLLSSTFSPTSTGLAFSVGALFPSAAGVSSLFDQIEASWQCTNDRLCCPSVCPFLC